MNQRVRFVYFFIFCVALSSFWSFAEEVKPDPCIKVVANENAAISACQKYVAAQLIYKKTDWDCDGTFEFAQSIFGNPLMRQRERKFPLPTEEERNQVKRLVPLLSSDEFDSREMATEKLIALGPRIVCLLELIGKVTDDEEVRALCRKCILAIRKSLESDIKIGKVLRLKTKTGQKTGILRSLDGIGLVLEQQYFNKGALLHATKYHIVWNELGEVEKKRFAFLGPKGNKLDGLFASKNGTLNQLVERSFAEAERCPSEHAVPFNGYCFKILTSQGVHAKGGQLSYLIDGNLTKGHAMIAYPKYYGVSGRNSFMINHSGKIFKCDLGAKTLELIEIMNAFNPSAEWADVSKSKP